STFNEREDGRRPELHGRGGPAIISRRAGLEPLIYGVIQLAHQCDGHGCLRSGLPASTMVTDPTGTASPLSRNQCGTDDAGYFVPQISRIVSSVLKPWGQASLRVLAQYHRGASGLPGVRTRLPGICRWPLGSVACSHFQA